MTDQPKWTPGPWAVEDHDGKTWVVAYCGDDDPWFVCEPEPFIGPGTIDRAPANAHLIAAAPDMVAVLEYYADQFCEGFCKDLPQAGTYQPEMDLDCSGCKARAALAKARGETK